MKQRTWRRRTMRERWRQYTLTWCESASAETWAHRLQRFVTMGALQVNIQTPASYVSDVAVTRKGHPA